MTVARAKGARGRADMLVRRLVQTRVSCERCGAPGVDAAHIVRRNWSAVRCLEGNLWFLCRSCHRLTEDDPLEFIALVERTIGRDRYRELRWTANLGLPTSSARFWAGEVERLTELCKGAGIDTRWRAAS